MMSHVSHWLRGSESTSSKEGGPMACACSGSSSEPGKPLPEELWYDVKLPNGRVETVKGEHAAKVAVTMAGGGTYSVR